MTSPTELSLQGVGGTLVGSDRHVKIDVGVAVHRGVTPCNKLEMSQRFGGVLTSILRLTFNKTAFFKRDTLISEGEKGLFF